MHQLESSIPYIYPSSQGVANDMVLQTKQRHIVFFYCILNLEQAIKCSSIFPIQAPFVTEARDIFGFSCGDEDGQPGI
jgi:hypothetical protein